MLPTLLILSSFQVNAKKKFELNRSKVISEISYSPFSENVFERLRLNNISDCYKTFFNESNKKNFLIYIVVIHAINGFTSDKIK